MKRRAFLRITGAGITAALAPTVFLPDKRLFKGEEIVDLGVVTNRQARYHYWDEREKIIAQFQAAGFPECVVKEFDYGNQWGCAIGNGKEGKARFRFAVRFFDQTLGDHPEYVYQTEIDAIIKHAKKKLKGN